MNGAKGIFLDLLSCPELKNAAPLDPLCHLAGAA